MPMIPRHLIYLVVPFYLSIAMVYVAIHNLVPDISAKKIVAGMLICFALIAVPYYSTYYTTHSKENWKGIACDLEMLTVQGDTVIVVPSYVENTLGYYFSNSKDGTYYLGLTTATELENVNAVQSNGTKYYVITSDIVAADPSGAALAWIQQHARPVRDYGNVMIAKGV
jgi:hypothetical protein